MRRSNCIVARGLLRKKRSQRHIERYLSLLIGICLIFLLSACQPGPAPTLPPSTLPAPEATLQDATPSPTQTTPTAQPSPSATSTAQPSLALLVAPQSLDEPARQALQAEWQARFKQPDLTWNLRDGLPASNELPANLHLAVVYAGDGVSTDALAALAAASPQAQFLAVGISGLAPANNLSTAILQPDQAGFIAGVIAAMLTPDWRVGVLSVSGSAGGMAARNGFLNGVVYFCGLCNPYHGPIVDYPLYAEAPAGASSAEWQAAAQALLDKAVKTVYIAPGAADLAALEMLAAKGVTLIGSQPVLAVLNKSWAVSILLDEAALEAQVDDLLAGQALGQVFLPPMLADIHTELFGAGKEQLVRSLLADLLAGYIDTGVDLQSGEMR